MKNLVPYNLFEMAKIDVDYQQDILRNFLDYFRYKLEKTTPLYGLLADKIKEMGYQLYDEDYNLFEMPQYVKQILFFSFWIINNKRFSIKYSFTFNEYFSEYTLVKELWLPDATRLFDIKKYRIHQIKFAHHYDQLSEELISLMEEDLSKLNKENIKYKY